MNLPFPLDPRPIDGQAPRPRKTVLLVDDEPWILQTSAFILAHEGYRVLTAKSAEEASTLLERKQPHALLLDVKLPGMSGYELCRTIRSNPATAALPILIVTAFGRHLDRQLALEAGADGFLRKPFDDLELLAMLSALCHPKEA